MKKSTPVASRREFLGVAAAAVAFPYVISSSALGADGVRRPAGGSPLPPSAWAIVETRTSAPSSPATTSTTSPSPT